MDNEIYSQYLKRAAYKGHEKAMLMYGLDLLQTSKDEKVQKESLFLLKRKVMQVIMMLFITMV